MISYAKLNMPFDTVAMQQQVQQALAQKWQAHFNTLHYEGEWTVLPLKAPGGDTTNIFADAMQNNGYANTQLMEAFPAVKQLLTQLQCETMSVRLLNLKAGAIIKEHRDHELHFEKGEARLHFPVFTNEGVAFYLDNDLLRMQEGEAWYINANLPHRVNNFGSTDRIHLVVDCVVNDWLKELFEQAEKKTKAVTVDVAETERMIAELRKMNTPISIQMANDLADKLLTAVTDNGNDADGVKALKNWLPYHLFFDGGNALCKWLYVADKRFTEPFFDETISVCKQLDNNGHRIKAVSSIDILPEWLDGVDTVQPTAFIFHVSRCGSTLAAQLLSLNEANIVLSEVPFIDQVLRWRNLMPDADETVTLQLLQASIASYAQKRRGNENRLIIKTDSWHVLFYRQLRKLYPQTPFILLYRKPDEVIKSHQKLRGMQAVQGVIEPEIFGFDAEAINLVSLDAYMAMVLEKYYASFLEIMEQDALATLINYNEGAVGMMEKIGQAASIRFTEQELYSMQQRAGYHAKYPKQKFDEEATVADIPAYQQKAFDLYNQLEAKRNATG